MEPDHLPIPCLLMALYAHTYMHAYIPHRQTHAQKLTSRVCDHARKGQTTASQADLQTLPDSRLGQWNATSTGHAYTRCLALSVKILMDIPKQRVREGVGLHTSDLIGFVAKSAVMNCFCSSSSSFVTLSGTPHFRS